MSTRPHLPPAAMPGTPSPADGPLGEAALLRLLAWLSPQFPIGGYSFSHGIEHACATGLIRNACDLRDWIAALLGHGSGGIDASLVAASWRAETAGNDDRLAELATLADAWRATAETALESRAQGHAFLTAIAAGWPAPRLDAYRQLLARIERQPAYACAVGVGTAIAGIPLAVTVLAFVHAFAAGLVSAGVRLIPLGQSAALRVTADLEACLRATAAGAIATPPEAITACALAAEWTSARHETQDVRLFRS